MEWLNYQHLQYFWVVARLGGVRAASDELRLAPSTISVQLRQLSEHLGQDLFERAGRRLVLTAFGRDVFRYADTIFTTGRELLDFAGGRGPGRPRRLDVGVSGVIPKMLAQKVVEPALEMAEPVHLLIREDRQERLLEELAAHRLDVVLTDAPVGPEARVKVFTHALGSSGVTFFAAPALRRRLVGDLPGCLDGAPLLVPTAETALRRLLDHWLDAHGVHPQIVAEIDDSAMLKAFGRRGHGVFAAPDVIADELARQYQVEPLGPAEGLEERFYAVSIERRLRHPAVAHIKRTATALLRPLIGTAPPEPAA